MRTLVWWAGWQRELTRAFSVMSYRTRAARAAAVVEAAVRAPASARRNRADVESVPSQTAMALAIALGWRRLGCGSREQGRAQLQLGGAVTVGEKADMADAMEPVGHGMQQEPPDELVGGQSHHLGLALVSVVFQVKLT